MHLVHPLVPFKLLGVRVGEFLPVLWDDHFMPQSFNLVILILRHNFNVIIGHKINQIFFSLLFLFSIWLPDLPQPKSLRTYYALSVEVFPFICFKFFHCSFHWEHACFHIRKWGKEKEKEFLLLLWNVKMFALVSNDSKTFHFYLTIQSFYSATCRPMVNVIKQDSLPVAPLYSVQTSPHDFPNQVLCSSWHWQKDFPPKAGIHL